MSCEHVPGEHNDIADDLSQNKVIFGIFVKGARSEHIAITSADNTTLAPAVHRPRLALSSLDSSVPGYMEQGLAASTQRVYKSAIKQFAEFCTCYNVHDPFLLSEKLCCVLSRT